MGFKEEGSPAGGAVRGVLGEGSGAGVGFGAPLEVSRGAI